MMALMLVLGMIIAMQIVCKLFILKKDDYFSIYIEGIGTKEPKKNEDGSYTYYGDFTRGKGFGTGETGLKEKARKGLPICLKN